MDFIFLDNINEIEANIEKTGAINTYAIYQSIILIDSYMHS